MLSYKKHYSSQRPDGRFNSTLAAFTEFLRNAGQQLSLPEDLTREKFLDWQEKIHAKYLDLLQMPEFTEQPDPLLLSCVQRDGYRVEKWEFYPDDYTAVPFLILIPDQASAAQPVPAVMCLPGSRQSKEFIAGEPMPDHPNYSHVDCLECSRMALEYVKNNMTAVAFDHLEIGECALQDTPDHGETQRITRMEMNYGYLHYGANYLGWTVFQKLCVWKFLRTLPYIDHNCWAVSGHALGAEAAVVLGALLPDIRAVVCSSPVIDELLRYTAITEKPVDPLHKDIKNIHIVPEMMRYFSFPEMCAALAPKFLALTAGGADEFIQKVERAYKAMNAVDRLQISPRHERIRHGAVPRYGLSSDEFYREWNYFEKRNSAFCAEEALQLLHNAFSME